MRKTCLECVAKHLGSAAVYIEEFELGYHNYYGYAYGELAHASSECRSDFPDLAWAIREHRIMWGSTRNGDNPHKIPFEALFGYIETLMMSGENIEAPEEIYAGLEMKDGKPVFSMDTRP